ncbi:hypothetical protein C8Q74DRAFT_543524 [Fomes fomentarius]|nr:hypothetical protein C8Q74DRAFT_543524 [Fomes fomentarius]
MEKSTHKHSLTPLSALPSAAPSDYTIYAIGSAKSDAEGSYIKSPYSSVMERSPLSSEQGRLTRSSGPLSALRSAAPSQYTATSPFGAIRFEAYDQISLDSAGADRRSFTQEADIVSVPYYTSYQVSRVGSPSLVAPIRPVVLSYQPATLPQRLSSVTPMTGPNGE